ncbi:MAG: hypothetical protein ACFE9L_17470 [Candidatus Hodarchaeota archaeon]
MKWRIYPNRTVVPIAFHGSVPTDFFFEKELSSKSFITILFFGELYTEDMCFQAFED